MSEQITGIDNDYGVLRDVLLGKPSCQLSTGPRMHSALMHLG